MQKQIVVGFTGSMNKDINPSLLKDGDYIDARNVRIGYAEGSNVGVVENVKGTLEIRNNDLTDNTGRYQTVGKAPYEAGSIVYFFLKDSSPAKQDMICEFNMLTRSITTILKTDLKLNKRIITARYFKDMLIWNDTTQELRCIFVSLAKSGYSYSDYRTTTLIKFPPSSPITTDLSVYDTTKPGLVGPNQYQFIYRYIFVGNQRSVWSVPSRTCVVPDKNYEYVRLFLNATEISLADQYVGFIKSIEIGFTDDNTQPYKFFKRVDFPKTKTVGFYVDFYNNAQYPVIATDETGAYYSDVPQRCSDFTIGDNRILTSANVYGFNEVKGISAVNFVPNHANTPVNNKAYFLSGGQYYVGVVLYDKYDRSSFVYELGGIKVKDRSGVAQFTSTNITITGQLPSWVSTWRTVMTKCVNKGAFIQAHVTVVSSSATELRFNNIFITPTPNEYAWTFTTGDKFSLYTKNAAGDAPIVSIANAKLEYDSTSAQFVVKGDFTGVSNGALVEIYSPITSGLINEYYETGDSNPVFISPDGSRYFGSNYSGNGHSFVITGGDTIFSLAQNAQIKNINNTKFDTWFRGIGRINVISQDPQQQIENLSDIAYSDPYVQGTKLNGFNSFQFSSKKTFGIEFGDIQRIVIVRDFQINGSVLLVVTQNNCYSVYLSKVQLHSTNGSTQLATSKDLLGSANLLAGGFGTINPESVHVFGTTARGWDALRGVLWRYSNDGLTPLSMEYGMNNLYSNLATKIELTRNNPNQSAIACYDPYFDEYLICIRDASKTDNPTFSFNEGKNGFSPSYDFDPDDMCTLNRMVISWKNGVLYLHRANDKYNILQGEKVKSSVITAIKENPVTTINAHAVWAYAQDKWSLEIKGIERTGARVQQLSNTKLDKVENQEDVFKMPVTVDQKADYLKSRYFTVKLELDDTIDYLTVLYGVAMPVSESEQNPN